LELLTLNFNQISTISGVSQLTALTGLWLFSNQVSDISELSQFTNLDTLHLGENPLNAAAYCIYLPLIRQNNPGISLVYDPNPATWLGDCDGDCDVDFVDFARLAPHWREFGCGQCDGADQNDDGNIDAHDLKILADNWLEYFDG
jgi:hypothetical protein